MISNFYRLSKIIHVIVIIGWGLAISPLNNSLNFISSAHAIAPKQEHFKIIKKFKVGGGIIAPQAILAHPLNPDVLIIASGRGETYGRSYLYLYNHINSQLIDVPLPVGRNANQLFWFGNKLIVLARNSKELFVINISNWAVEQNFFLQGRPVSGSSDKSSNRIFIAFTSGLIQQLEFKNEKISVTKNASLKGTIRAILYYQEKIYVTQPSFKRVDILSAKTFELIKKISFPGYPTFNLIADGDWVLASDRDGFLNVINVSTGFVKSIDLFPMLGIKRKGAVQRIIDTLDLVLLPDKSVILVNNRTDSLHLDSELNFIKRLPKGARGTFLPLGNYFFITRPSTSKLIEVSLKDKYAHQTIKLGTELVASTIAPTNLETIFVLSDKALISVSELGLKNLKREVVIPSLVAKNKQLYYYAMNKELLQYTENGADKKMTSLAKMWPISSTSLLHKSIMIISRLHDKIALLTEDNNLTMMHPSRSRPRKSAPLFKNKHKNNEFFVIVHDTNPDMGITIWDGSHEVKSIDVRSLKLRGWPSDVANCQSGTVIVSSFAGDWLQIDHKGVVLRRGKTHLHGVDRVTCISDTAFLLSSPEQEKAFYIDLNQPDKLSVFDIPDIVNIHLAKNGFLYFVTKTEVLLVTTPTIIKKHP